jgi:hypothetical protein
MATTYRHLSDLAEVQPPAKGIRSRTLYNDDRLKAVAFGFAQGEELSEHTASMPAVLHFLRGEAKLRRATDSSLSFRFSHATHSPPADSHDWTSMTLPSGSVR